MVEVAGFNKSVVDKKQLFSSRPLGKFGFSDKAFNSQDIRILIDWNQLLIPTYYHKRL